MSETTAAISLSATSIPDLGLVMASEAALTFLKRMGCDTAEHDTGCTFLEHLSGVANVLASWGEPESVANAGLFHSIYGTELFQGMYQSVCC